MIPAICSLGPLFHRHTPQGLNTQAPAAWRAPAAALLAERAAVPENAEVTTENGARERRAGPLLRVSLTPAEAPMPGPRRDSTPTFPGVKRGFGRLRQPVIEGPAAVRRAL